jgi:hypothetical protein
MKNTLTLYEQTKAIEKIDKNLKDLKSSKQINVTELQRTLFKRYESNLVFGNAVLGSQTIEETLEELGQVNKGIKKILPWKKDKFHNYRLEELGELISTPYHLETNGIFMPDNLITAGAEITAMAFGSSYFLLEYLFAPSPNLDPHFKVVLATSMSALLAPAVGLGINMNRFSKLPRDEAKYLDEKIQEFYK